MERRTKNGIFFVKILLAFYAVLGSRSFRRSVVVQRSDMSVLVAAGLFFLFTQLASLSSVSFST